MKTLLNNDVFISFITFTIVVAVLVLIIVTADFNPHFEQIIQK